MALINRMTRLFTADLHAVLDRLEEPDVLLKHAIREMEDELALREHRMRSSTTSASSARGRPPTSTAHWREPRSSSTSVSRPTRTARAQLLKRRLETEQLVARLRTRATLATKALADGARAARRAARAFDVLRQKAEALLQDGRDPARRTRCRSTAGDRRRGRGGAAAREAAQEPVMTRRPKAPAFIGGAAVASCSRRGRRRGLRCDHAVARAALRDPRHRDRARRCVRAVSDQPERRAHRPHRDGRAVVRRHRAPARVREFAAAVPDLHVASIWLVRSLYFHNSSVAALADSGSACSRSRSRSGPRRVPAASGSRSGASSSRRLFVVLPAASALRRRR